MFRSHKIHKRIIALYSLFSISLNIIQPFFFALAPVIAPYSVSAQEVPVLDVVEPLPSVEPTPVASVITLEPTPSPLPSSDPLPSVDPSPSLVPLPTTTPSEAPTPTSPDPAPAVSPSPAANPDSNQELLQILVVNNTIATSIQEVDFNVTETGSAVLLTDKLDYAPTDTALITGAGFLPNTSYTLTISSTDNPATTTSVAVVADESGKLFYAYQLDGIYRPNYKVEAYLTSLLIATVTFTDSEKVTICHATGSSSNPYSKLSVDPSSLDGDGNDSSDHNRPGHQNGEDIIPPGFWDLDGRNWDSAHREIYDNDCNLPEKAELSVVKTNDVSGSVVAGNSFNWTFTISNTGTKDATFSNNQIVLKDNLPPGANYGTPIENKSNFVCNISSSTLTCTSSSNFTIAKNSSFTVQIPVTTLSAGSLINPREGGVCAVDPDDKVSESNDNNNTCGNTVTVTPQKGNLVIIKNTVGGNGTFAFTTTGAGLSSFNLTTQNGTASKTFSNINSGTYSVSETVPSEWSMSASCDGSNNTPASITVAPGATVTCTFTNTKLPTLTVNKEVRSIAQSENGKFNLLIDNTQYASDIQNGGTTGARILSLGKHTVAETAGTATDLTKYTVAYAGDCDANGEVTLSAGDNKTCTIINTRKSGKILLDKILSGGDDKPSLWDFTIAGITGTFKAGDLLDLATGTYTITESNNIPGYSLTAVGGVCSSRVGSSAQLNVALTTGDAYNTCSFTNTRDVGVLKVNKQVDLNGDGDYDDSNEKNNTRANMLGFRWSLNSDAFDKHMGNTLYNIPTSIAGVVTHTVYEKVVEGYHLAGWSLSGNCNHPNTSAITPNITKDSTTTVTLCNVRDTGTITIVKDARPDSDTEFEFESDELGEFELVDNKNDDDDDKHNKKRDDDEDDEDDEDEDHDSQDAHNRKVFKNIKTGSYDFTEEYKSGWTLSDITCTGTEVYQVEGNKLSLELGRDEDIVCTFINDKNPQIIVDKVTNPSGSTDSFTFTLIKVEAEPEYRDDDDGSEFFDSVSFSLQDESEPYSVHSLTAGQFRLSEASSAGWENTDISCDTEADIDVDDSNVVFNAGHGDVIHCTFENTALGNLEVTKYNDLDGDGTWDEDEPTIEGVEITLSNNESIPTGKDGVARFERLVTGFYQVGENLGENSEWRQTGISCDQELDSDSLYISAGNTTYCTIGNQAKPVLTLAKSNNATGSKNGGDLVTYRLIVRLSNSHLTHVSVVDVPPEGFEYVTGSFSALRNGLPFSITEPNYGSPGTWTLGDLVAGDVIELTYTTKINSGIDAGSYTDMAWASGDSRAFGSNLLAQGVDSSYIDESFVGTDVSVHKNYQATGAVDIVKQTGEVLGVSTAILPQTGVDTKWLYLALLSFIAGIALMYTGLKMRKFHLVALILFISLSAYVPHVSAADPQNNLSLRLSSPSSTMRVQDWKLSYSVLDRQMRTPSVTCYVKKPGNALFTSFDIVHVSSKPQGDNASCQVNSSVMSQEGEYQFYVTAVAGADSQDSSIVNVKYDVSGPGEPNYYAKEHPSSCKYIIKFHTASDNDATSKVEIYSSDSRNFDTNDSTRVGTVNIGSNMDGTFTHDRADGCDKEWYYVIRAFDNVGNQSSHRGDEIKLTSSSSTSTSDATGAIALTTRAGNILGTIDSTPNSLEPQTEVATLSQDESSTDGDVLGVEQDLGKTRKYLWILSGLGVLAIIYGIARKNNITR